MLWMNFHPVNKMLLNYWTSCRWNCKYFIQWSLLWRNHFLELVIEESLFIMHKCIRNFNLISLLKSIYIPLLEQSLNTIWCNTWQSNCSCEISIKHTRHDTNLFLFIDETTNFIKLLNYKKLPQRLTRP